MPHSTVNIKIDRDGGVVVYTGASEIGQGSDTMTAQIAAEVLGCSLGRIRDHRRRHRSHSHRHRLLLQPRNVHGGQRHPARLDGSEEADCLGGRAQDELRAGRSDLPRRYRLQAGKCPTGRVQKLPMTTSLNPEPRSAAASKDKSCAARCSKNAKTKARKIG